MASRQEFAHATSRQSRLLWSLVGVIVAAAFWLCQRGSLTTSEAFVTVADLEPHGKEFSLFKKSATAPAGPPTFQRPGSSAAASAAIGAAALALGIAVLRAAPRQSKMTRGINNRYERKWWSIKETADPTTLPMWQRDFRYGFYVLRNTMIHERRAGRKVFWDVRVTATGPDGCKIEMLNSGIPGFVKKFHEGPRRLEVGEVVKMECINCPTRRVDVELQKSPWPVMNRTAVRTDPEFSHHFYLEQQRSIEKAKELKAGQIIEATVYKHCQVGMVMTLEGPEKPKGMLKYQDISRKMTAKQLALKFFPEGTPMRVYVIHADAENGRITLGTKEFEDDLHMGWMLSFPERLMANAEEGVRKYHEKRDAYIAMLQR